VTGGEEPSVDVGEPAGTSAAKAPPERGPPRLAAVSPPPASADNVARHTLRRGLVIGGLRRDWSSCGVPMIVVGVANPRSRGRPTVIHIGRQARSRKGFVIAPAERVAARPLQAERPDRTDTQGGTPQAGRILSMLARFCWGFVTSTHLLCIHAPLPADLSRIGHCGQNRGMPETRTPAAFSGAPAILLPTTVCVEPLYPPVARVIDLEDLRSERLAGKQPGGYREEWGER
jgi:hypothetical protein